MGAQKVEKVENCTVKRELTIPEGLNFSKLWSSRFLASNEGCVGTLTMTEDADRFTELPEEGPMVI